MSIHSFFQEYKGKEQQTREKRGASIILPIIKIHLKIKNKRKEQRKRQVEQRVLKVGKRGTWTYL